MSLKKIAVIIPVYNEALFLDKFLHTLFEYLPKIKQRVQVLIIDDGSTDKTARILEKAIKKYDFITLTHQENQGKGAALRTGTTWAQDNTYDAVIMMDGDCQHHPEFLPEFIQKLREQPVVFGYRNFDHKMSLPRQLGNNFASWLFKNFFVIKRSDPMCGFMAFRTEVLSKIAWQSDDYGVEGEISALVGKHKISFAEVNISTIYLDKKTGFNIHDAVQILFRLPNWYALQNPWFAVITKLSKRIKWWLLFGVLASIYLLLSFKYIFRPTSLIGNLEPYPDSLYYAVPAWNVARGNGWGMFTSQYHSSLVTPPLYSLYLIPFFWLISDVRVFYAANMLLGIGSLGLLILIFKQVLSKRKSTLLAASVGGFFYVTNFYIYTIPSLLMAENITLFLVMVGIWSTVTQKKWLAGWIPVLLLLVKFSNFPLSAIFALWYAAELYVDKQLSVTQKFKWVMYGAATGIVLLLYIVWSQVLSGHKNLQSGQSFSTTYFIHNFQFYVQTLLGFDTTFLWLKERLISPVMSLVTVFATSLWYSRKPNKRILILSLLLIVISTIIFISFFVTPDARYVSFSVPILAILFSGGMKEFIDKKKLLGTLSLAVIAMTFLLLPGAGMRGQEPELLTIKKQVGLNLKYSETPWNYLAVQHWNDSLSQQTNDSSKKIYLGTFLPPYYLYLLNVGEVNVLPLSAEQEFFNDPKEFTERFETTSITELYTRILQQGGTIYVSPYYVNNVHTWQKDYQTIENAFRLEKVSTGCLEGCNLYQVLPR